MAQTLFNGAHPIKTNIAADYITWEAERLETGWGWGGGVAPTIKKKLTMGRKTQPITVGFIVNVKKRKSSFNAVQTPLCSLLCLTN